MCPFLHISLKPYYQEQPCNWCSFLTTPHTRQYRELLTQSHALQKNIWVNISSCMCPTTTATIWMNAPTALVASGLFQWFLVSDQPRWQARLCRYTCPKFPCAVPQTRFRPSLPLSKHTGLNLLRRTPRRLFLLTDHIRLGEIHRGIYGTMKVPACESHSDCPSNSRKIEVMRYIHACARLFLPAVFVRGIWSADTAWI